MAGALWFGIKAVQSAPSSFSQADWSYGIPSRSATCTTAGGTWSGSECLMALTGYSGYSAADAGITAGTDIKLLSTDYAALPTSDTGAADTPNAGGFRRRGVVSSIDRHSNAFFRLEVALESLIHAFGKITRDPNFSALITGLNGDVLKKVKMSFDQSVQGRLPSMQFAAALGAQRIFHNLFSLRVLGSSHFAGSSQWTVMI